MRTKVAISAAMTGGFGARLRRHRESQHIDLATIAEQTKIKRSLLEGLERDDVSHWPSGIFRRAWVRSYAQAVSLDVDETVREFLQVHPDPEEIAAAEAAAAAARPDPAAAGLRGVVTAALGSLSRRMLGTAAQPEAQPARPVVEPQTHHVVKEMEPEPIAAVIVSPAKSQNVDLGAIAGLCTRFGQVANPREVQPLLQEVATLLDATGLIVWLWHSTSSALRPVLVHGYSAGVVARLPAVTRDADNPTAESFRSGQVREIDGDGAASGAVVLPLLLRAKCVGVVAIELRAGTRLSDSARAVATILTAAIAQLVGRSQPLETKAAPASVRRARLAPVRGTA